MATRFTVTSRIHLAGIMASTGQLWASLPSIAGLVGYSFAVSPIRGTLYTLSAWRDRNALNDFVRGDEHVDVVRRTGGRLKSSSFTDWVSLGEDLPPTWTRARTELGA